MSWAKAAKPPKRRKAKVAAADAARAALTHAVSSRTCPCPAQALFLGRYPSKKCR